MTPECTDCRNFRVGLPRPKNVDEIFLRADDYKHKCVLTDKSALWERATKVSMPKAPAGNGLHWTMVSPVHDNCGYEGRFFKGKIS